LSGEVLNNSPTKEKPFIKRTRNVEWLTFFDERNMHLIGKEQ
jgi:hypothetical protein